MLSYRDFLEFSENFYLQANRAVKAGGKIEDTQNLTIASLLFSWMSIECFINNMMLDFTRLPADKLLIHEKAFLLERQLEFVESGNKAGEFHVSSNTNYIPLENKILFLVTRFGDGTKIAKGDHLWQRFTKIKTKRDQITHPRKSNVLLITLDDAADAFEIAKAIISMVSERVWGTPIAF